MKEQKIMRVSVIILALFLSLGCGLGPIQLVPRDPAPATEIEPGSNPAPAPAEGGQVPAPAPAPVEATAKPAPTATPADPPTPAPAPVEATAKPAPTPTSFLLQSLSTCPSGTTKDKDGNCCPYNYTLDVNQYCAPIPELRAAVPPPTPRHGLLIAFVLPFLCFGIPWAIAEVYVVRFVQPKSLDLSSISIKAKDGLFIDVTISFTARKIPGIASTRASWGRVQDVVEKAVEQELVHQALSYEVLADLEWNLKDIADGFNQLPIVKELITSFGVDLMRFNIETRYPLETVDALNKKAEASAGGTAYLAYAAAAHLDPDSREARELYRVYEETKGNIDAARNLGSGLSNIAEMFTRGDKGNSSDNDSS